MTTFIGAVFALLGLLSGVILLQAPFGLGYVEPGLITWIMFPSLTVVGYCLLVIGARNAATAMVANLTGGALLILGVAAIVCLFLAGNGLIAPDQTTAPLWYVVVVGFLLGGTGFSLRHFASDAKQS